MRIRYSKDVDILYLSFAAPKGKVATVENENGDLLRIDTETGGIVGVQVLLFQHRLASGGQIDIPEISSSLSAGIGHAFVESIRVQTH